MRITQVKIQSIVCGLIALLLLHATHCLGCMPKKSIPKFITPSGNRKLPPDTLLIFQNVKIKKFQLKNRIDGLVLAGVDATTIPLDVVEPDFGINPLEISNYYTFTFLKPVEKLHENTKYLLPDTIEDGHPRLSGPITQTDAWRKPFEVDSTLSNNPNQDLSFSYVINFDDAGMCGVFEEHSFLANKNLDALLYLMKIRGPDRPEPEYLLVFPIGSKEIRIDSETLFKNKVHYQVSFAPISASGQVGLFSKPVEFTTKVPPPSSYQRERERRLREDRQHNFWLRLFFGFVIGTTCAVTVYFVVRRVRKKQALKNG